MPGCSPLPRIPQGHELHVWVQDSNPYNYSIKVYRRWDGSKNGHLKLVDHQGTLFSHTMAGILRMEVVDPTRIVDPRGVVLPRSQHTKELILKVGYTWGYGFLRFTCVKNGFTGELEWRDSIGNLPSAYKICECDVVELSGRPPGWNHDTPEDQMRVLLSATR